MLSISLVVLLLIHAFGVSGSHLVIGSFQKTRNPAYQNLYNGSSNPTGYHVAVTKDRVMFFDDGQIYSMQHDGTNVVKLYCGAKVCVLKMMAIYHNVSR
jgi:hypothetical protein